MAADWGVNDTVLSGVAAVGLMSMTLVQVCTISLKVGIVVRDVGRLDLAILIAVAFVVLSYRSR